MINKSDSILLIGTTYETGYNRGFADATARVPFATCHRLAAQRGESWAIGYVDGYADACGPIPVEEFFTLLGLTLEGHGFLFTRRPSNDTA